MPSAGCCTTRSRHRAWRSATALETQSRSKSGRPTPTDRPARKSVTRSATKPTRNTDSCAVRPQDNRFKSALRSPRPSCKNGYLNFPKCRAGTAVLWQRPPAWRLVAMSRSRFTGLIVHFAAVAALAPAVLTGCDHPARFAADAHADTLPAAPPAPAQVSGDRQFAAMPSLAPIVKQLRPTVVNVASRFKPRRIARNQRPQGRNQRPNPFENSPGDDDENGQGQEDPMERLFRFFGGGPQGQGPDQQERHGLGSGFLIGDGYVLTNNHVVEIQDPGSNKFRPMDDIKVSTDETAPGGSREVTAKVDGQDPKPNVALVQIT